MIRQDGKRLKFLDRFKDLFRRVNPQDHFVSSCQKLALAASNGGIAHLSAQDQLAILVRFKQILPLLRQTDVKRTCVALVEDVEKAIMKEAKVSDLIMPVFQGIASAGGKKEKDVQNRNLQKLSFLCNFYGNHKQSLEQITAAWLAFSQGGGKKPADRSLEEANDRVVKILLDKEENLLEKLNEDITDNFDKYPSLLSRYLDSEFKKGHYQEVSKRLTLLQKIMDKNGGNVIFIRACIGGIHEFLNRTSMFSQKRIAPPEVKKRDLLCLKGLFGMLDKYMPAVDSHKVLLDLRVKCANLPCPAVRTAFPNLFLSEKDQLDILIAGLQEREDKEIQILSRLIRAPMNPTANDLYQLAKLVSSKSGLSQDNRLQLRMLLSSRMGAPQDWDDFRQVKDALDKAFLLHPGKQSLCNDLKRISKAKMFFRQQLGLSEEMIMIPRWYHATHQLNIQGIIGKRGIEVRHEKAYRGAWISTQREASFGRYVLSLSNRIVQMNPSAFIGYEYFDKRWRGIQKTVPIKHNTLVLVGVPAHVDKTARKTDKLDLVRILQKNGFANVKALSADQVDYMEKEVAGILGAPNLPDQWWGKGRAYSEHQQGLLALVRDEPVDAALFRENSVRPLNQLAIARMVQQHALPLYKQPMPPNPSYRSETTDLRVELEARSEHAQGKHFELIRKMQAPARGTHGTMHCVRTTLWTQLLARVYDKLGRNNNDNPILLATAGAFHDVSREDEGPDHWDGESAAVLETLLKKTGVDETTVTRFVQTVREKDPKNGFTTDAQRVVHDADCLEIIRVVGKFNFSKSYLSFYNFDSKQKAFCDQLVDEVADFIKLTDTYSVRTFMEHNSDDFYGDMVRVLFAMNKSDPKRFPLITGLLREDMQEILKAPETQVSERLLAHLKNPSTKLI